MVSPAGAAAQRRASGAEPTEQFDQRVFLRRMSWKDYEILLAVRGERSNVRMYYSKGDIELMSPSRNHEGIKTLIGRLLEAYSDENGIELNGYGSWTLRSSAEDQGAEPDECYTVGASSKEIPDLAIEVVWTHGGLDKLEIYRSLGVRELWIWERQTGITVHVLRGGKYEQAPSSELFPELDLPVLSSFLDRPSHSQAVRELRATLRAR